MHVVILRYHYRHVCMGGICPSVSQPAIPSYSMAAAYGHADEDKCIYAKLVFAVVCLKYYMLHTTYCHAVLISNR